MVYDSGMATTADRQVDGLQAGADEYLVKSIEMDALRARIRTLARLRHTTAALRASQEHYRRLIEILPDGLSVMDLQGRMLAVNQEAVHLLGYASQEELLATSAFDLTPSESRACLAADIA